eukprot:Gb_25331 [translate_table: standard]
MVFQQINKLLLLHSPPLILPFSPKFIIPSSFERCKCRCSAASQSKSVSVASVPDNSETLSARERRRLRNERREQAKSSKPPWREEVENKLLEKVKKPKLTDEMNLSHLAVKGVQWWMVRAPRNSERIVAEDLSKAFPKEYPDMEFDVYLPQIPSKRKLKDGSYSNSKKMLFPGCVFIRCIMNREILDFVRSCPGVCGFVGTKIGNTHRWIIKPNLVPANEMEAIRKKVKEAQEEYDREVEEELSMQEKSNKVDSIGQDKLLEDFEGENVSMFESANPQSDPVTELSTIDRSGKQVGIFPKRKSRRRKLSKASADSMAYMNESSAKEHMKLKDGVRRDSLSKQQDSIHFGSGSMIMVISGPFAEFTGYLKEFSVDTGKAKVMLKMFGHETPIDLDINQVEYQPSEENGKF